MKKFALLILLFVCYCYFVGFAKDANAVMGVQGTDGLCYAIGWSISATNGSYNNQPDVVMPGSVAGLPYYVVGSVYPVGSSNQTRYWNFSTWKWVGTGWLAILNKTNRHVQMSRVPEYTDILDDYTPPDQIPSQYWPTGPPVGCGVPPPVVCTSNEIKQGTFSAPGKWPPELCLDGCKFVAGSGLSMYSIASNETWFTNPRGVGIACQQSLGTLAASPVPWPEGKVSDPGTLPPLVKSPDGSVHPDQDKDGEPSGPIPVNGGDIDNDGDTKKNIVDSDINGNEKSNAIDPDIDGDGVSNGGQSDRYDYAFASPPGSGGIGSDPEVDGDGQPNSTDMDIDGDGISNSDDIDMDGDGYKNSFDQDVDGDGILNIDDATKNGNGDGGDGTAGEETATDQDGDGEPDEITPTERVPQGVPLITAAVCPEGQICIGDGVCSENENPMSDDCASGTWYNERFQEFKDDITGSGVFTVAGGLSVPGGGSSAQTIDMGRLGGAQSFDWSSMSGVWTIFKSLFLLSFAWISIKIITMGK